jgi:hypothetical protein
VGQQVLHQVAPHKPRGPGNEDDAHRYELSAISSQSMTFAR